MSGHGRPSWDKYRAYGPLYEEVENAELAVRLGSIVTHDRRGRVLFLDSFEQGNDKWVNVETGVGADVTLYSMTARNGGLSLKLLTSAVNDQETGIERYTPLSVLSALGLEGSLIFPAADAYAILYLSAYDGVSVYTARIRYRISTKAMSYWGSDGAWHALSPTQSVYQGGVGFSTLKLVIDPTSGYYKRAILNGREWPMTTLALQTAFNTTAPCLYTSLRVAAQDSEAVAVPIDDIIITQNEP